MTEYDKIKAVENFFDAADELIGKIDKFSFEDILYLLKASDEDVILRMIFNGNLKVSNYEVIAGYIGDFYVKFERFSDRCLSEDLWNKHISYKENLVYVRDL